MKYIVDSFQLFLPCDTRMVDYFYQNHLKKTIFVRGAARSSFPILYCDNTLSTIKKSGHLRKYAFPAEKSGKTSASLGWRNEKNGTFIPSESFSIDICAKNDFIKIEADTTSDYHLEYQYKRDTSMGKWENWMAIYMPLSTAFNILKDLQVTMPKSSLKSNLRHEKKQTTGKREDFYYTTIPLKEYQFTYESFELARDFLHTQGFNGTFPGICYNGKDDAALAPVMKIGYVHTKEEDGDFPRDPQIAIKLTQSRMQDGTKARGRLQSLKRDQNYMIVDKQAFSCALISALYEVKTNNQLA